jgi:hypothetical protein
MKEQNKKTKKKKRNSSVRPPTLWIIVTLFLLLVFIKLGAGIGNFAPIADLLLPAVALAYALVEAGTIEAGV